MGLVTALFLFCFDQIVRGRGSRRTRSEPPSERGDGLIVDTVVKLMSKRMSYATMRGEVRSVLR